MLANFLKRKKVLLVSLEGWIVLFRCNLLKQAGYDVTGVFIKTWQPDYIELHLETRQTGRNQNMRSAMCHFNFRFRE